MFTTLTETQESWANLNALSVAPLTLDYQHQLQKNLNTPIVLAPLRVLKRLGFFRLLSALRHSQKDLYLICEEKPQEALLPILEILAFFTPAKNIYLINNHCKKTRVSKLACLKQLPKFVLATFNNLNAVKKAKKETSILLKNEIHPVVNIEGKNILYLNANLWIGIIAGGSLGHISGVCNALTQQNYNIIYTAINHIPTLREKVKFHALIPEESFGFPVEGNLFRHNHSVIKQLLAYTKNQKITMIYQRLSIANYTGVILSRKLNVPLIIEYNGSEVWVSQNWGAGVKYFDLTKNIEDITLKHAHVVVTISDILKKELIARGVDENKIVCYPNCVDPKVFDPERFSTETLNELRHHYSIAEDSRIISFIGTFGQWHGVEVLATAIRDLIDSNEALLLKEKIHFMMIGDGLTMPEVKLILNNEKYRRFVTYTGLIPQIQAAKYLALAEILMSPHVKNPDGTSFFGSPTKLFEYMAMGKAIIASDLEQIGEVLKNSLHADNLSHDSSAEDALSILCEPGNNQQIVDAMIFLINYPEIGKHLGQNAKAHVLKNYTWEHHVNAILTQIKKVNSE